MIVAMQEKATEEQIDAVIAALVESGVEVHRTTGEMQTILAAVGNTLALDLAKFEIMPGVMHVHRISSPYKLAGRGFRPDGTVVEFRNGVSVGGKQVVAMAGPCSIENREQIFETARRVRGAGGTFLRGGAFKPRSSPYAFQGMGIPGLELMRCTCMTPGMISNLASSSVDVLPTAARMVCISPVVRWTSTPDSTSAAMTASICSSVAFSCMATIIACFLSPAPIPLP